MDIIVSLWPMSWGWSTSTPRSPLLTTSHALTPDVDVRQLSDTEQHRIFKERSGLLVRHPEAKILFSRPTGYGQILDLVEAHAYQMSVRAGELVPLEEATADWYETEYLPAIAAVHEAELPQAYEHTTKGDIYLGVQAKRRELRTTNRNATWADAALAARREGVSRREQRALKRERRRPFRDGANPSTHPVRFPPNLTRDILKTLDCLILQTVLRAHDAC